MWYNIRVENITNGRRNPAFFIGFENQRYLNPLIKRLNQCPIISGCEIKYPIPTIETIQHMPIITQIIVRGENFLSFIYSYSTFTANGQ